MTDNKSDIEIKVISEDNEVEESLLNKEADTIEHSNWNLLCKCRHCVEEDESIWGGYMFSFCFIPCMAFATLCIYLFSFMKDLLTCKVCKKSRKESEITI